MLNSLHGVVLHFFAHNVGVVVKEVSYQVSEPTVESQVVPLESAGVDTFLIAASPKFAAQAIRKTFDIGWAPLRI
jgi:branched-chain amino acid transport system substrate-binding protein